MAAVQSSRHTNLVLNSISLLMAAGVAAITVVAATPSLREKARGYFRQPYRQVLAKARGDLTGHGKIISVIKIKTDRDLHLEVFESIGEGDNERLWMTLNLEEKNDGYVTIRAQPTNLALTDVDGDGISEIVAPAYDDNLIPRLHVFKFDETGNTFLKMERPN